MYDEEKDPQSRRALSERRAAFGLCRLHSAGNREQRHAQPLIGKQLYLAKIALDTDDLLAWTVIIVTVSVLSEKMFMRALKRVLEGSKTCRSK